MDALACMLTLVVTAERQGLSLEGSKPKLLAFSPFMVYAIHGWCPPFAGFRFVIGIFSRPSNLDILAILQVHQEWIRPSPRECWATVATFFWLFVLAAWPH